MREIAKDIFYVGVDDLDIDLFEGMYRVPDGVSYNSYVIKSLKTAVVDSVDCRFEKPWLDNIDEVLGGSSPDYLIVQHMEPDHSACVAAFINKYPNAVIVGNQKTFVMLEEYFGAQFPNRLTVAEGDELSVGDHVLKFIFAPMVHWPEVMFTYDESRALLFSADAFGKFGALCRPENDWVSETRRYYIGIVGKYGVQVRAVFKKLTDVELKIVAPLHGPVLTGERLNENLRLYTLWSGYEPECDCTLIAYSSVYGHTKAAAELLAEKLTERGAAVKLMDLAREDWSECVAQAFRCANLVVAAPTYNADIFPAAREFIDRLVERNYQNRTVAFIENGTWALVCAKLMRARFEKCKNLTYAATEVKVRAALNEESKRQAEELAEELAAK